MFKKKGFLWGIALLLIFCLSLIGCGNKHANTQRSSVSSEAKATSDTSNVAQKSADAQVGATANSGQVNQTSNLQRKIIRHATLTQKVTAFEASTQKVQQLIDQSGGFIQSSTLQENQDSLRLANYILRIPEGKYGSFLNELQKVGKTSFITQKGDDVTQEFYDNDAHIKNLKLQEEAVQRLMEKAVKMEDILKVQAELSRIRGEIETLQGKNKYLDNLSSLATIDLKIQEVKEVDFVEDSSWLHAKEGFIDSVQGVYHLAIELIVLLITLLPYILFIGVPLGFVIWRLKKRQDRDKDV